MQLSMINLLKKCFEKERLCDPVHNKNTDAYDIRVATCALLLEMANIDGEFSKEEHEKIISMLKINYKLSDEDIDRLLEASRKELNGSVDLWQFTNLINKNYSREEKNCIVEMIWKVIYVDGRLDKHEDYLVHKLGRLLHMSHKELIGIKIRVEDSVRGKN